MQYLGSIPLPGGRGSRKGLLTTDEATGTQLMSFVWVDRDRRYFISTCSSLEEGTTICRTRWTQTDKSVNAEPVRQERNIAQPKAAEMFYKAAGKIDQHNRHRQDSLRLERKLQTTDWSKRVNITIFGMIVIDAFLLMKGCQSFSVLFDPKLFIEQLALELVDNDYDRRTLRRSTKQKRSREVDIFPLPPEIDTSVYLTNTTPTKRLKKNKKTGALTQCKQGRCMVCKHHWVTTVCRECQKDQPDTTKTQFWCCKSGSECFDKHVREYHPDKIQSHAHVLQVSAPLLYCIVIVVFMFVR